jgi:hypothetical protein
MNFPDLETLAGRKLKRLPVPRAPRTLLPRVLAAAEAWTRRPWYERAWFTWPIGWQAASIVGLAATGWVTGIVLQDAQLALARAGALIEGYASGAVSGFAEPTTFALTAVRIVGRALLEPLLPYRLALAALMGLACAAVGAALNRVVPGKVFLP